jgi:N-acetylglucosamine-6-sulfatase
MHIERSRTIARLAQAGSLADLPPRHPYLLNVVLIALLLGLSVAAAGLQAADGMAGQAAAKRPNIVLILTDDQSYESVAVMPYVSRLAGWYTFTNAYINNSTCCPSRATILTGQWSHHHGVETTAGAPRFDDHSTLATWLDRAGYRTALVGKYHLGNVNEKKIDNYIPPGWDEWYGWHGITGSEAYYNYTLNQNGTLKHYGSAARDYSTDVLSRIATAFIRRSAASTAPFFLYFAPRGPHNPWIAAPRHLDAFRDKPVAHAPNYNEADMSDKPAWWRALPLRRPSNLDNARRKEWATLLSVDDAVRAIVTTLTERGLMKNTVVVFMTDNGYAFGEHRHLGKICPYEECNKTPLMMWYPGGTPRRVPQLVSNVDIAPTFAALAGISPGAAVDGHSLVPLLRSAGNPWPYGLLLRGYKQQNGRPSDIPTFWGIRFGRYKYIETVSTGETELYDLKADPFELSNVAGRPQYASIRASLARRLARLRTQPPR